MEVVDVKTMRVPRRVWFTGHSKDFFGTIRCGGLEACLRVETDLWKGDRDRQGWVGSSKSNLQSRKFFIRDFRRGVRPGSWRGVSETTMGQWYKTDKKNRKHVEVPTHLPSQLPSFPYYFIWCAPSQSPTLVFSTSRVESRGGLSWKTD